MPRSQSRSFLSGILIFALGCASDSPSAEPDKKAEKLDPKRPEPLNKHDPRNPDGSFKYTNRLKKETSPYLLQHAHNPVDWHPWGDEAFALAKKQNKPVFLSIGYSTCHWCHVMEKESFANEEVAKILNEQYICIKVDREERPDVDHVYMNAVQMMGRGGGWPLTAFLTPDKKPFFGGTYFPPDDARGLPGLKGVLKVVTDAWKDPKQKAEIDTAGEDVARALRTAPLRLVAGVALDSDTLAKAADYFKKAYDKEHGGFGGGGRRQSTKFPRTHVYNWLLRHAQRTGDKEVVELTVKSLEFMSRGGIYDHLGGGFHRYSVDREWLVPHFEKMLYDQALIARTLLEAHQVSGSAEFARVVRETFDYVLRDMTHPAGGFYSAEDADSEGVEGKFYVWTKEELGKLLGAEAELFCRFYNVGDKPNFEEAHGSILHVKQPSAETFAKLADAREKLLAVRAKRIRPHLDDKILAGWNGLMIGALALGYQTLGDEKYLKAAERAADFVLSKLRRADGRLLVAWRADKADKPAFIDDYAFLADGLFELYQASGDPVRLKQCVELTDAMLKLFLDDDGAFNFTGKDAEKLIATPKEVYDGAIPSGNSVAAGLLLRLGKLTMKESYSKAGAKVIAAFAHQVVDSPQSHTQMLCAHEFDLGPTFEIVLAGDPAGAELKAMQAAVRKRFLPNKVTALRPADGPAADAAIALVPFLKEQVAIDGKPTAYVCRSYVCALPVHTAAEVEKLLNAPVKPLTGPVRGK